MQFVPELVTGGAVCAGSGVFSWAAVAPSSQLFGPTTRHTGDSSTIALTFDDGPNPVVTPSLLELLARHDVTATFFLIGKNVETNAAIVRDISARGHVIGNHTHTHPNLTFRSSRAISQEIERCDDAIESAAGGTSKWIRPPFGYRGPALAGTARKRAQRVAMWSFAARDWKLKNAEALIRRLRRVQGGDIVLLHDGDHRVPNGDRHHTVAALECMLPRWKDAGFRFVTMDEIGNDR